ncbi:heterokaryon incompatibility protein-domain-containing protein [Microdochium bolleyi]|uniref:Heterokaryon incompatibility protein-domain-containing protein n=1 Tax=Microdochium bolleyi TaxID=196109 RepID=A0A136IQB1_9PEZI|nr:heterokaryon incompatibility protein-domain-containing protein [Microdochium bolleyi]
MARPISKTARQSLSRPSPWARQARVPTTTPLGWEREQNSTKWKAPPANWRFSETYLHWFLVTRCKHSRSDKCTRGRRCRKFHATTGAPETITKRAVRQCLDAVAQLEDVDGSLLEADRNKVLKVMQQWCCAYGLRSPADTKGATVAASEAPVPFTYDYLDRSSNVIRVLSFDKPAEASDATDSEVISCQLETVNLDAYTRHYRLVREEIRGLRERLVKGKISEAQKESFMLLVWRNCNDKQRSDPTAFGEAMQMWDRQVDTPADIKRGDDYLEPRFYWGDFLALSYIWGDADKQHQILLNGQPFMVRDNLYKALRRLRISEEVQSCGLKVWVDAICINQNDLEERAFQVSKMANIYSQAVCVRAWVGEPAPGTEADFVMLHEAMMPFQERYRPVKDDSPPPAMSQEMTGANTSSAFFNLDDSTLRTLQRVHLELLSEAYWNRLWIVQEMQLASSIVLWYGNSWFPPKSSEFRRDLFGQIEERGLGIGRSEHYHESRPIQSSRGSPSQMYFEIKPEQSLFAVLLARDASASDPRDKVYGILGLVHPDIASLTEIDYSDKTSAWDAYISFAVAFITVEQNPASRAPLQVSMKQLHLQHIPTWAFDFDDCLELDGMALFPGIQNRHMKSRTSRRDKVQLSFSKDKRLLSCQAYLIDVVTRISVDVDTCRMSEACHNTVGRPFHHPDEAAWTPLPGEVPLSRLSVARILYQHPRYEFQHGISPIDIPWIFIEYHHLSHSHQAEAAGFVPNCPLITVEDGSTIAISEIDFKLLCWNFHIIYKYRDFRLGSKTLKEYFPAESTVQLEGGVGVFDGGNSLLGKPLLGSLAGSSHGFIGTVPKHAEPGDLICVLPGKDAPVLLRHDGPHYQLIGECFFDGLMQQEAHSWAESGRLKLENITLC